MFASRLAFKALMKRVVVSMLAAQTFRFIQTEETSIDNL